MINSSLRIDLDGKDVAAIEDEHVEHAKKQLDESKAKVAEKRKELKVSGTEVKTNYKKKDAPKFKATSQAVNKEQTKV